ASNADERGRLAVTGDDADVVLGPEAHRGYVAYSQPVREHHTADVLGPVRLLVGDDEKLPVVLGHPPHGLHRDGPSDRVRQIRIGQSQAGESGRVRHDLDFPYVGSLNVHTAHPGHAGDQRLDLVARDIVEGRGVAPRQVVRVDGEQGGGEPLDLDLQVRRQRRLDLPHSRPDQLERVRHVGAWREGDGDLTRPADGVRLDARHAGHHTHRLLQRSGDTEHHLPGAEGRALSNDFDPGELELGVNGRGQLPRGPHTGKREECHGEVDEAALPAQDVEQRHRAVRAIRAPSATPYAPVVTTTAPATLVTTPAPSESNATESPARISAASAAETLNTTSSDAGSATWTRDWFASTAAPSTAVMRVTTPARGACRVASCCARRAVTAAACACASSVAAWSESF